MQNKFKVSASILLFTALVASSSSQAIGDPGLLLIAHGAPNPKWNEPVLDFGHRVADDLKKEGRFKAIRTALLEFAKPDIPTAIAELEAEGCDRIVAVPLFIAPSGHTLFDVPAMLGIYSSPKMTALLASEGAKAATPRVPIILTSTLSEGDVLRKYALDEVRKLSKSPRDEAIVILAHGDREHQLLIERLLRQVTTYCCGKAGISYGDWACVEMGQEYQTQGVPAIKAALGQKKRVLVVGLYLSTTASQIHLHSIKMMDQRHPSAGFPQENVAMSDVAIISHPECLHWVLETARIAGFTESKAMSVRAKSALGIPSL